LAAFIKYIFQAWKNDGLAMIENSGEIIGINLMEQVHVFLIQFLRLIIDLDSQEPISLVNLFSSLLKVI
jgi:hypothetical protein